MGVGLFGPRAESGRLLSFFARRRSLGAPLGPLAQFACRARPIEWATELGRSMVSGAAQYCVRHANRISATESRESARSAPLAIKRAPSCVLFAFQCQFCELPSGRRAGELCASFKGERAVGPSGACPPGGAKLKVAPLGERRQQAAKRPGWRHLRPLAGRPSGRAGAPSRRQKQPARLGLNGADETVARSSGRFICGPRRQMSSSAAPKQRRPNSAS